jgi:hypothetical protein
MSDNVNVESEIVAEVDIVGQLLKDKEIRKLSPGSDEYKVAFERVSKGNEASEATAAAEGDDLASTETSEDGSVKARKPKGLDRRFSELTSERDEARRKSAELEARLAELESKPNTKSEVVVSTSTEAYNKEKPAVENFETYSEFQEALVDWKLDKKEWDAEQRVSNAKQQEAQKEVLSNWETREATTKERVEGYDQLVDADFMKSFTSKNASREAMQYLLESDNGPDLLFDLAEDDAKLAGFKSMSPVKQVAYLAKLEAKFEKEAPESKATQATTRVHSPSPNLPRGKTVTTKYIDSSKGFADNAEYRIWREQNRKK